MPECYIYANKDVCKCVPSMIKVVGLKKYHQNPWEIPFHLKRMHLKNRLLPRAIILLSLVVINDGNYPWHCTLPCALESFYMGVSTGWSYRLSLGGKSCSGRTRSCRTYPANGSFVPWVHWSALLKGSHSQKKCVCVFFFFFYPRLH